MTTSVFKFLWTYISKLKLLFFVVLFCVIAGEILARFALYFGSQIVETLSLSLPKDEAFKTAIFFALVTSAILLIKGIILNVSQFLRRGFCQSFMRLLPEICLIMRICILPRFLPKKWPGIYRAKSRP